MTTLAAWIAVAVLTAIAVVQVLAASGRPVGAYVWGGRHRVLPRRLRVASALSPVLYTAIAAVLLGRSGSTDGGFLVVVAWVVFAYFVLGIGMNAISRSPRERAVMTPACLVLAAASLVVALG